MLNVDVNAVVEVEQPLEELGIFYQFETKLVECKCCKQIKPPFIKVQPVKIPRYFCKDCVKEKLYKLLEIEINEEIEKLLYK